MGKKTAILKMVSPHIRIGEKMKIWLNKVIKRDFGNVSFAKGLYNIIVLYRHYVPKEAIKNMRKENKRRITKGEKYKNGFKQ